MSIADEIADMTEESSEHDEFDECSCECKCLQDWDCDCEDDETCDCPVDVCFCVRRGCACTIDQEVTVTF